MFLVLQVTGCLMMRVLPLLLLVIEVVNSPCLHVLHLVSEWQSQNPGEAEPLIVDDSKPGNIYFLPKIHQKITPSPGRPICNTIDTPTMNLSRWVDIQLQPLVKNLPSYLKDDNHFLQKIDKINKNRTLPRDALLVTCDVRSLYTNIPHKEGLEALKKHFIMRKYREKRQTLHLSSQS